VDILRGFALFGILLVNMTIFYRPLQTILFPADPATPWFERAAEWLWRSLTYGKPQPMGVLDIGKDYSAAAVEAHGGTRAASPQPLLEYLAKHAWLGKTRQIRDQLHSVILAQAFLSKPLNTTPSSSSRF
jgi:hypothetical protein